MKLKVFFLLFQLITLNISNLIGCCPVSAYYTFTGNALDISGNANNATTINATLTTDRNGVPNSAYYFNGISDYIEIPDNPTLDFNQNCQFAIAAWINPEAGYGSIEAGHIEIVSKWGAGGVGNATYLLGVNDVGNLLGWTYDGANGNYNTAPSIVPINQWTYVVIVKTNTQMKYYINGLLSYTAANTINVQNSTYSLFIGAEPVGGNYFKGKIDEVELFPCALSDSEILDLYNDTQPINCAPPPLCTPLAIRLLNMQGYYEDNINYLTWEVEGLDTKAYFEINQSFDNKSFMRIATISSEENKTKYFFEDKVNLIGINYYKLKLIDSDGYFQYSNTIEIDSKNSINYITIYPNPSNDILKFSSLASGFDKMIIFNTIGNTVDEYYNVRDLEKGIDISHLAEGFYTIKIVVNGNSTIRKLVKIK